MNKNELINKITELNTAHGFLKKSNKWICVKQEITKVIHLQKSSFGNKFYLNFGFILNEVDLHGAEEHISDGIKTIIDSVDGGIVDVFDLENNMSDTDRSFAIASIIRDLHFRLSAINDKSELITYLKMKKNLNSIRLKTKEYLGLTE
jgi:hypothetical protein